MSTEKKAKHGHESDDDDYYERFVRSFQHNTGDDSEELAGDEEASFQGDINMDDDEDDDWVYGSMEDLFSKDGAEMDVSQQSGVENSTEMEHYPMLNSTGGIDKSNKNDFIDDIMDLEMELGELFEEDFESALASYDLPPLIVKDVDTNNTNSNLAIAKASGAANINNTGYDQMVAAAPPTPDRKAKFSSNSNSSSNSSTVPRLNSDAADDSTQKANGTSNISNGGNSNNMPTKTNTNTNATSKNDNNSITHEQIDTLRKLQRMHFQLCLQQLLLATRSASHLQQKKDVERFKNDGFPYGMAVVPKVVSTIHMGKDSSSFVGVEALDELAEILDGAVIMLQEMDQNRKDAIRKCLQNMEEIQSSKHSNNNNNNKFTDTTTEHISNSSSNNSSKQQHPSNHNKTTNRRLTRAQFIQELQARDFNSFTTTTPTTDSTTIAAATADDGNKDNNNSSSDSNISTAIVSADDSRSSIHTNPTTTTNNNNALSSSSVDNRRTASVFDVRGLSNLQTVFQYLDGCSSIAGVVNTAVPMRGSNVNVNVLCKSNHGEACEMILNKAGMAQIEPHLIPGRRKSMLDFFSNPNEILPPPPQPTKGRKKKNAAVSADVAPTPLMTLTEDEKLALMRNRHVFTTSEDNLILRGVNLFGEKEWVLIADRFLPDRSHTLVSQRHSTLIKTIFQQNGIYIDDNKGCLATPPDYKEGIPVSVQKKMKILRPVQPPAIFNVHRWTIEEDIMLLKAVSIMGRSFAEVSNSFMPHRDRGHLRKRYQVLERKIKAVVKKSKKKDAHALLSRKVAADRSKSAAFNGEKSSSDRGISKRKGMKGGHKPNDTKGFAGQAANSDVAVTFPFGGPMPHMSMPPMMPPHPGMHYHPAMQMIPMPPFPSHMPSPAGGNNRGSKFQNRATKKNATGAGGMPHSFIIPPAGTVPPGHFHHNPYANNLTRPKLASNNSIVAASGLHLLATKSEEPSPMRTRPSAKAAPPAAMDKKSIAQSQDIRKNANVDSKVPQPYPSPDASNSCLGFQKLLEVDQEGWSNMTGVAGVMSQNSNLKTLDDNDDAENDGTFMEGSRILSSLAGLNQQSPSASGLSMLNETVSGMEDSRKSNHADLKSSTSSDNGVGRTKALFSVIARANEESSFRRTLQSSTSSDLHNSLSTPLATPRRSFPATPLSYIPHADTLGSFSVDHNHLEFSNFNFSERSRLELERGYNDDRWQTSFPKVRDHNIDDNDFDSGAMLLLSMSSPAKSKMTNNSPIRKRKSAFPVHEAPQDLPTKPKKSFFASTIGSVQEREAKKKRLSSSS